MFVKEIYGIHYAYKRKKVTIMYSMISMYQGLVVLITIFCLFLVHSLKKSKQQSDEYLMAIFDLERKRQHLEQELTGKITPFGNEDPDMTDEDLQMFAEYFNNMFDEFEK